MNNVRGKNAQQQPSVILKKVEEVMNKVERIVEDVIMKVEGVLCSLKLHHCFRIFPQYLQRNIH